MTTLLLVDDDEAFRCSVSGALEDEGFEVVQASHGQEALEIVAAQAVHAVVSDVNMPFMDGFTLCRTLREADGQLPILLLTSRDSEIDEVLGLDLGADDYMTKPFSTRVLVSRLRTLLRRSTPKTATTEVLESGLLHLNLERLELRYGETALDLTLSEIRLVEAVMRHPGRVFSRAQLLAQSREEEAGVVGTRIVDTYVARIRRKLREAGAQEPVLETVVGVGYRLRDS